MAQVAEGILEDAGISEAVSNRLLSNSMPPNVRASRREFTSVVSNFPKLHSVLREAFRNAQPAIAELRGLWRECTSDISPFEDDLQSLEADLIERGLFAQIVRGIEGSDLASLNAHIVAAAKEFGGDYAVKSRLLNLRSKIQSLFFADTAKKRQVRLALRHKADPNLRGQPATVDSLIQQAIDQERPSGSVLGAFESKSRVDRQISGIQRCCSLGKCPKWRVIPLTC